MHTHMAVLMTWRINESTILVLRNWVPKVVSSTRTLGLRRPLNLARLEFPSSRWLNPHGPPEDKAAENISSMSPELHEPLLQELGYLPIGLLLRWRLTHKPQECSLHQSVVASLITTSTPGQTTLPSLREMGCTISSRDSTIDQLNCLKSSGI